MKDEPKEQEAKEKQPNILNEALDHQAQIVKEHADFKSENEALRQSVSELIEIAEDYATLKNVKEKYSYPYYDEEHTKIKSAIERAKQHVGKPG